MGEPGTADGGGKENAQTALLWTCPFCNKHGINRDAEDNSGAHGALRSHIYFTDGGGHGSQHTFPEGFDPDTIPDYITEEDATD